jgi:hypothetical protein
MKTIAASCVFVAMSCGIAFGWGQEGHSIVAEVAQHRFREEAGTLMKAVEVPINLCAFFWRVSGVYKETNPFPLCGISSRNTTLNIDSVNGSG